MTTTTDPPCRAGQDTSSERLSIDLGSGEAEAIRALTTAIGEGVLPDVFASNGQLVHLSRVSASTHRSGDAHSPPVVSAEPLTAPGLAFLLAHHTHTYRTKKDAQGEARQAEISPTKAVLSAVLSQRYWPRVRPLVGVVGAPVLRPDGSVVQTPGYDPETGLYYAPTVAMPPVPDTPTADDVAAARAFLLDRLLGDFPFVAPADRANHIGLLFAPILRPYLNSLTPFGLISATTPSSGKTLLAEIIGYLYGHKNLVWRKADDAELEKAITSALHSSAPIMLWDNLPEGTMVASAVLAQLLTSPEWSARMLGSSGAGFTATNDRLWLATGNNIRLGGDMCSRTVLVRLDPNHPNPEQRDQTRFSIPHLDTWLKNPSNRASVLRHLLVLVVDWINAGAPRSGHAMRQFTTWAQATGGLLAHHQIDGFLGNLADLRDADDDNAEWVAFLARWWDLNQDRPLSVRQLRAQAETDLVAGKPIDRWEGAFLTDDSGRIPSAKSIGRTLTGHIGRWHGPYVLRSTVDRHANARVFWVEQRATPNPEPDPDPEPDQPTLL